MAKSTKRNVFGELMDGSVDESRSGPMLRTRAKPRARTTVNGRDHNVAQDHHHFDADVHVGPPSSRMSQRCAWFWIISKPSKRREN